MTKKQLVPTHKPATHLTLREEQALITDLNTKKRDAALDRLISSYFSLVVKHAYDLAWRPMLIPDLIQEGCLGLLKAINNFKPELGFRLSTLASYYIKAEMYKFIINNWSILKIVTNKEQKHLFLKFFQLKKEQLDTIKALPMRDMSARVNSMYTEHIDQLDLLPTSSLNPSANERYTAEEKLKFTTRLQLLDPRSRDIILLRWGQSKKATLDSLAKKYHISSERVRQIERKALIQLRSGVDGD